MKVAPLQLKNHFFPKIVIVANPEIKDEDFKENRISCNFEYEIQVTHSPSDPPKESDLFYEVQLTIVSTEREGFVKSHDINIVVIGLFAVAENYPQKRRLEMLEVLGPTMLFGSLREFLYLQTCRGRYPTIYLPTVSFIPDDHKPEPQQPDRKTKSKTVKTTKTKAAPKVKAKKATPKAKKKPAAKK